MKSFEASPFSPAEPTPRLYQFLALGVVAAGVVLKSSVLMARRDPKIRHDDDDRTRVDKLQAEGDIDTDEANAALKDIEEDERRSERGK